MVLGAVPSAPAGQVVRVRLLGQFAMTSDGRVASPWPRPSARRLCALVMVSPDRRVTRDFACDQLFPGLEPRAAARSLSKALSLARNALSQLGDPAAGLLATDLNHIWVSRVVAVDAEAHEEALRAGLTMRPGRDRDDQLSAALAEEAELLADEPYADWALRPRERLEGLRQQSRLALARDRATGAGRSGPDDVVTAWQSCLDHDRACEEAAGALVRAYLAQGRRELAARAYHGCRTALEDLGLRISPSLENSYAAVTAEPGPLTSAALTSAALTAGAPPAGALREERRPVTVLFAELAAPTGLVGTGGLEALREIVGTGLASVISEVEALGGTVTSVSGRGLQAMFGAPQAHEDDPERALRAAFRALSATTVSGGTTLRIGVETGPAVVGPIGAGAKVEYGALGDVVSVAAALQSSARPGSALVGPATRTAAGHLFTWGGDEEVALGEHGRPLTASYLGAPSARPPGGRLSRLGGRAPLAGRRAEMSVLDAALRRMVDGRGSVVILTGEPGIGKTRLVQECRSHFMAWVGAGSGSGPLWLEGRCASYTSATPYGLYQQVVASWVGMAPDQPAARLRPALLDSVVSLMGNTNLLPPLARMMGLSDPAAEPAARRMSPGELQQLTFGAMRSVVSRLTVAGPVVLVLEDLHWADPTSLRLTRDLAELVADRPLLILVTSRPGADRDVAGLADAPLARLVRLRPLPANAAEALARSLIGEAASREVLDAVLASTDGNPLFLEEWLFSLMESGTMVHERETWRLRATADPRQQVPDVLERLVRSRIDRLSPAAQEAIRAASVLGTEFPVGLLAAVSRPREPLEPLLNELCASDLLRPVRTGELPADTAPAFRFRHALIQEATYVSMLGAERRGLHARAAAALAAVAGQQEPGQIAAVIGRHYAHAGDADQALRSLELAGDHATDAFANDEAISLFREALAVARGQDATAVRLHAKLANVLWRTGQRDQAGDTFRAALRLAGSVPPLMRAHLHTRLGRLEFGEHRFAAAAANFDAAEALLGGVRGGQDDQTADQWLEMMLDGRADMYANRLEPDLALSALEAARPLLEARGTSARRYAYDRVFTHQLLIRRRYLVGEADLAPLRRTLEAMPHTVEDKDLGYASCFLGWVLWVQGNLTEARERQQTALAMAERIGEIHLRSMSLTQLALIALREHRTEEVRSLVPRVIAATAAAGTDANGLSADVMACQAWLAWQDGHVGEVIRLAREIAALGPARQGFSSHLRWVHLWPVIAARLSSGETAGVAAAVEAGRQLLDPAQQLLPDDLADRVAAACAAWDRGDAQAARELLAAALTRARDLRYC